MQHPPQRSVVTIGVFDGVHRAHQRLLRSTAQLARRLHGTSLVMTFYPDPHAVLHPTQAPPALMPLEERLALMHACGISCIWVIPFSRAFSRMTATRFIDQVLVGTLHATGLIVGEGFLFGKNRAGDMETLRTVGPTRGIRVVSARQVMRDHCPISSSRIRRLIAQGALVKATQLLGRAPALYGTVVHGAGRGRQLGFPTVNVRLTSGVVPPHGVYAVRLHCAARRRTWRGLMNLGVRPTFGAGPTVCEVHLLRFSGTLQGQSVRIELLGWLRRERRFASIDMLCRQIRKDLLHAQAIFRRRA